MSWPAAGGLPPLVALCLTIESHLEVMAALTGWRAGIPRHELALLNRLTERLRRVGCSSLAALGVSVMNPAVRIHELHGAGTRGSSRGSGTDAFGADFAITVELRPHLKKTAFLQLKRFDASGPRLEKKQLEDAQRHQDVWERSYVAAAQAGVGPIWVSAAQDVLRSFPKGQRTRLFPLPSIDWQPSLQWTLGWLSCEIGLPSAFEDPESVEVRLAEFAGLSDSADEGSWEVAAQRFPEFSRLAAWYNVRAVVGDL